MLKTITRTASVAAACMFLAGCGGSGSSASVSNGGGTVGGTGGAPPEKIQGVATPSSVAVVTATNAN